MSDCSVGGSDVRHSMLRVWMALSAVWIAFWLVIAAIILLTVDGDYSLGEEMRTFSLIVLLPPFALLGTGIAARWTFVMLARQSAPR